MRVKSRSIRKVNSSQPILILSNSLEESYTCARQYDLALYDWEDLQSTDQIREGSIIWLYGDCSAEFNKSVLYKAKLYSHFNKALLINKNN